MTEAVPSAGSLLLIDDDEVTLRLLKVNLERGGYAVVLARTGSEGLDYARQNLPDLVLADALLPDMAGQAVCEGLIASSRTRHIPVIIMSSKGGARDAVEALQAGADDFLTKPLNYSEVTARVRAHIRRAQLKPALNPLTGLPGNLIIEHEIRQLTTPGHGLYAVLYADFNQFMAFNDVYGFPAGDDAIRLLGEQRHPLTAAALLAHLADSSAGVRQAVVRELGAVGGGPAYAGRA